MRKHPLDRYELIRPIFLGGMTDLHVAKAPNGERVVVRRLKQTYARDRLARKRFLTAADILKRMHHPHIVRLIEYGKDGKQPFMVLEYVESRTLRECLVAREPRIQNEILPLLRQMASALYFIHHVGFLYLDFKPENILVRADGSIVLIDFDLTVKKRRKPVRLPSSPGTPAYVAPEVITTLRADERADIFSFGVVAYEMATWRKPFERDTPDASLAAQTKLDIAPIPIERFAPDTPRTLREMIVKCLAKDMARRYPDMSLILKTIESMR